MRTPNRPGSAGTSSGSRSHASTSPRPTCGNGSAPAAPSTASRPPASYMPSGRAASTLDTDDDRVRSRLTASVPDAFRRAANAAHAASDKKGADIVVLDVGEIISITEVFVLVSAANTRQVRTIVDEIELALKAADGEGPRSVEGLDDATWVLMDYGDVIV